MSGQRHCLFITATSTACAGEVDQVRRILTNVGIQLREVEWISEDDFVAQVSTGHKYDVVYLGAHADIGGFGQSAGHALTSWETLGDAICRSDCMVPGGILFLGCCRGGMKAVALKIFRLCYKIHFTCGPNWTVTGNDLTTAFHAFVQARFQREEDLHIAAGRATNAAGVQFSCYIRDEFESEIYTLDRIEHLQFSLEMLTGAVAQLTKQVSKLSAANKDVEPDASSGNTP